MVLQVPNKPAPAEVASAIDVIRDEWPELESDAIAHVFGEHTAQTFGAHNVPYVSPERVQDASYIRVLLAKMRSAQGGTARALRSWSRSAPQRTKPTSPSFSAE